MGKPTIMLRKSSNTEKLVIGLDDKDEFVDPLVEDIKLIQKKYRHIRASIIAVGVIVCAFEVLQAALTIYYR